MFANGSWRLDEHRKINEVAEFGASRIGAVENDHARGLADNDVCGDGVRAVGPRARGEVERMPCGECPASKGSTASRRNRRQSIASRARVAASRASHSASVMWAAKKSSLGTTDAWSATARAAAIVDFPVPLRPSIATKQHPVFASSRRRIASQTT